MTQPQSQMSSLCTTKIAAASKLYDAALFISLVSMMSSNEHGNSAISVERRCYNGL